MDLLYHIVSNVGSDNPEIISVLLFVDQYFIILELLDIADVHNIVCILGFV